MAKNTVWVTGNHAVNAVLSLSPERAIACWVVPNRNQNVNKIGSKTADKNAQKSRHNNQQQELIDKAKSIGLAVQFTDKKGLARQCQSEQHQGIALEVMPKRDGTETELEHFVQELLVDEMPLLLILDQVQDPHNFGACLRTADAAGAHAVVVAKDNASPMTPVVQKVASGAAETMPIFRVSNLARALDSLKKAGVWLIGTSDKAEHSLYQETLSGPLGLVMGAEGKGMRPLTERKCDSLVSLPMAGSIVSSLNVSVATGVCLYEIGRQRGFNKD